MGVLFPCMSVFLARTEVKEGIILPEIGLTTSCKPPFKCWELNPSSLQEPEELSCHEQTLQPPVVDYERVYIHTYIFVLHAESTILDDSMHSPC